MIIRIVRMAMAISLRVDRGIVRDRGSVTGW